MAHPKIIFGDGFCQKFDQEIYKQFDGLLDRNNSALLDIMPNELYINLKKTILNFGQN